MPRQVPLSPTTRRELLARACGFVTVGGLAVGSGLWLSMGLRFVESHQPRPARLFVARTEELRSGQPLPHELPDGEPVVITWRESADGRRDFVALSRRCPHLGCRVRWRHRTERFECPCHGGHFDAAGQPIAGPPLDERLPLVSYPLVEEGGLLFLTAPPPATVPPQPRRLARGAERGRRDSW